MAEQIRRRAARARAGVAMAVLALVGGAATEGTTVAAAKTISWLNLKGFTGGVRTALLKIEAKVDKADSALVNFETKVERTYLKTSTANASFLKIRDASVKFLKAGGTAANSNALGGLGAGQFVQGHGGVITGAVSYTGTTDQPLMGDGSVKVLIGLQPDGKTPEVTLVNTSAQTLDFTVTGAPVPAGATAFAPIDPGGRSASVPFDPGGQLDIQLFQSGGTGTVRTLTVSSALNGTTHTFVGQMLLGN
jgi:hypothetical protein